MSVMMLMSWPLRHTRMSPGRDLLPTAVVELAPSAALKRGSDVLEANPQSGTSVTEKGQLRTVGSRSSGNNASGPVPNAGESMGRIPMPIAPPRHQIASTSRFR